MSSPKLPNQPTPNLSSPAPTNPDTDLEQFRLDLLRSFADIKAMPPQNQKAFLTVVLDVDPPPAAAQISSTLGRHELFRHLSAGDQTRFLTQLVQRRDTPRASSSSEVFVFAHRMASIEDYVHMVRRPRGYHEHREGSFFRPGAAHHEYPYRRARLRSDQPSSLRAECEFLQHVLQYEAVRGDMTRPRFDDEDPDSLPPVSEILRLHHEFDSSSASSQSSAFYRVTESSTPDGVDY
ncbi:hypothetical protein M426DRAFT_16719 [Hypoxylon sp. CI-4A]|nr:hypothetical protein M426DRAFT_16719 [Hypoxylon sp. CI-4A]